MDNSKSEKKSFKETAREYRAEFGRITWPSRKELYKHTITVIFTTILLGAAISVSDFCFEFVITNLMNIF